MHARTAGGARHVEAVPHRFLGYRCFSSAVPRSISWQLWLIALSNRTRRPANDAFV